MGRKRADEKIFVCQQDKEGNIHYTTIIRLSINKISTVDSMFLASFHITVLINYVRLNCRIKFYLKTNNTY